MKGLLNLFTVIFTFLPLCLVALEGHKIRSVEIIGNERINTSTIDFYIKLKPGDCASDNDLNTIIKDLYKTRLFSNVSAYVDQKEKLVIEVRENPLINRVILKGNKLFSSKELMKNVIHSKSLSIFSEAKVQEDLLNLINSYRNNGKTNARVKHQLVKLDDNRVDLIFRVNEGKTSKVKEVRFVGNKVFSDDELEQVINSCHKRNLFATVIDKMKGKSNYLLHIPMVFKELIYRFYSSKGYINSNVQHIVEFDDNNTAHITFLIEEGQQFFFRNSEVDIAEEVQDLDLKGEIVKLLGQEENKIFNAVKVNDTVKRINQHLNERGYIFAKVGSEYVQHDNIVDITYKISTGKRIYINQIIINGNSRTLDRVIRGKLSITEGDPYDVLAVERSRKELTSTGFFEKVKIDSEPINNSSVNLNLNVKEKQTGMFNISGGMVYPGGLIFNTDIKERNLFGTGKGLSVSLKKDHDSLLTDIEIVENNFNDSDTSVGINLFYDRQNKQNSSFNGSDMGFSTKLSYKIIDNLFNSLRYSYRYNNVEYKDKSKEPEENFISTVGYTLTYNKLDNLYFPQGGYLLRLGQDVSGLGGNVNFLKSEFLSFYAHPILNKIDEDITLRLKAAAGYIFSYTDKVLSISQRFFKGSETIRGFDLAGIGPRKKNEDSLGGQFYFNATQQLDFPIPGLYNQTGIKGSLFVDYAILFGLEYEGDDKYPDSKLLRVSPGFGFSIPSPFGGRMRFDFGFPLVKEDYDIVRHFRFSFELGL